MSAIKIILVLIVICSLINWVRAHGGDWPIPKVFPLLSGQRPSALYTTAGTILLLIFIWGLGRLARLGRSEEDED